jgi:cytochrome P450
MASEYLEAVSSTLSSAVDKTRDVLPDEAVPLFDAIVNWVKETKSGKMVMGLAIYLLTRKPVDLLWRKVNNYPPGPIGLVPVLSALSQLRLNESYPHYRGGDYDKYGPLSMYWIGLQPFVMVNAFAPAKKLLITDGLVDRRPVMTDEERRERLVALAGFPSVLGLSAEDGARQWWTRIKLLNAAMSSMFERNRLDDIVANHIPKLTETDNWQTQRRDIKRCVFLTLFQWGFGSEFKTDERKQQKFQDNLTSFFNAGIMYLVQFNDLPTPIAKLAIKLMFKDGVGSLVTMYHNMTLDWMDEYERSDVCKDNKYYVDYLLDAVKKGDMTRDEAGGDLSFSSFLTTHLTNTNTEQTLLNAVRYPHLQDKLHQAIAKECPTKKDISWAKVKKIHYLKAFIYESLRLTDNILGYGKRHIHEKTQLEGYTIPKGTLLFCNSYDIGRDPALWGSTGTTFDPDRWLNRDGKFNLAMSERLVVLGMGKRNCAGRVVAERVMQLMLAHWLLEFEFAPAHGHANDIPSEFDYFTWIRDKSPVPFKLTRRS